jgi:hypothetical protein
MLRIYKNYNLPYRIGGNGKNSAQPVAAQQMTFPSYPAVPFSLDDFYQTSVGMVRDYMTSGYNNVIITKGHSCCRAKPPLPLTSMLFCR